MRTSHARKLPARPRASRSAVRTATAAAVSALVLAATGAAQTAQATQTDPADPAAPAFLEAGELPPVPSSEWTADAVAEGLPEVVPFCVDSPGLPAGNVWHRTFRTELDTGASQLSFVADDEQSAVGLAERLRESAANCAADWLRANPGGTASWQDLGSQDIGDGAHAYGLHIESPHGSQDVHLYGVGRDGDTVTLLAWGRMGTLADAPVDAYRTTLTTAVRKLAG